MRKRHDTKKNMLSLDQCWTTQGKSLNLVWLLMIRKHRARFFETLGNPVRSRVIRKHPVNNLRWESTLTCKDTRTHTHTHTPDDITQVEVLPIAFTIRFVAATLCICLSNVMFMAVSLRIESFLFSEIRVPHFFVLMRQEEQEKEGAAGSGS